MERSGGGEAGNDRGWSFSTHIVFPSPITAVAFFFVEATGCVFPHAHFLLIMDSKYKLIVPEQYDCLISAELPDKNKYPELYAMVVKHMMHGPCGVLKPNNVCMQDGSCKCRYPWMFNKTTMQGKDSYPIYRRRKDGRCAKV
jgi:hypothetical protein